MDNLAIVTKRWPPARVNDCRGSGYGARGGCAGGSLLFRITEGFHDGAHRNPPNLPRHPFPLPLQPSSRSDHPSSPRSRTFPHPFRVLTLTVVIVALSREPLAFRLLSIIRGTLVATRPFSLGRGCPLPGEMRAHPRDTASKVANSFATLGTNIYIHR